MQTREKEIIKKKLLTEIVQWFTQANDDSRKLEREITNLNPTWSKEDSKQESQEIRKKYLRRYDSNAGAGM